MRFGGFRPLWRTPFEPVRFETNTNATEHDGVFGMRTASIGSKDTKIKDLILKNLKSCCEVVKQMMIIKFYRAIFSSERRFGWGTAERPAEQMQAGCFNRNSMIICVIKVRAVWGDAVRSWRDPSEIASMRSLPWHPEASEKKQLFRLFDPK